MSWLDIAKNSVNNFVSGVSNMITSAPKTDQFLINGQLSPMEFEKAGDKLVDTIGGWTWKPSLHATKKSAYLPENKQFLMLDKVLFLPLRSSARGEPPSYRTSRSSL